LDELHVPLVLVETQLLSYVSKTMHLPCKKRKIHQVLEGIIHFIPYILSHLVVRVADPLRTFHSRQVNLAAVS